MSRYRQWLLPILTLVLLLGGGRVLTFAGAPPAAAAGEAPRRLVAPASCPAPSFAAASNFAVGTAPTSVAVGDFNRDGTSDLVTTNVNGDNVSVLLGTGSGGFSAPTNFGAGSAPVAVAVDDFNRDGNPDLAVANYGGPGGSDVSVLLGTGSGGFGAATNFGVGITPNSVAVGDFNRDSTPDLAVANLGDSTVSVLLGTGSGGFGAATNFAVGYDSGAVAVGDFNRDGNPDLVTANGGADNVSVLLGTGNGGFSAATNFGTGSAPVAVAVGDFNGDGNPDLVTANQTSENMSVLLGTGNGGFGAATDFAVGEVLFAVAVDDFNQDGNLDLVTANFFGDSVSVLLGTGSGGFGAATNFAAGQLTVAVAVGDFNQDGNPDLVTANNVSENVSVLLNTCAPPPPSASPTVGSTVTTTPTLAPTQTPASSTATAPTTPPPPPTSTVCPLAFSDVDPGNPFYPSIRCLACRSIVSGYVCGGPGEPCPGSYFRPNTQVTRGQVAKIIAQAAGFNNTIPSTQQTFADVSPSGTFWLWVERLSGRGIIGGYPCGGPGEPCVAPTNRPYFRANNPVTRGQLAKITSGAAGWTETPTGQTFADVAPGSTFALWIERIAGRGIVGGYPCGGAGEPCLVPTNRPYFRPNLDATRGQMSKIAAQAFFPNCATPARR